MSYGIKTDKLLLVEDTHIMFYSALHIHICVYNYNLKRTISEANKKASFYSYRNISTANNI